MSSRTRIASDLRLWVVFLAALVLAANTSAQNVTYAGRVVDATGASVAGARVEIEELNEDPRLCCGPVRTTTTSSQGEFNFALPKSEYVITADAGTSFDPSWLRVTASDDDIQIVVGAHPWTYLPDDPPVLENMEVGPPDSSGRTELRGSSGAVQPESFVIVTTLVTGHVAWTRAAADGSFLLRVFGPRGSFLQVQADPWGLVWRRGMFELSQGGEGSLSPLPATIIQIPADQSEEGFGFADVGSIGDQSYPIFWLEGTIDTTSLAPGSTLSVDATVRLESDRIADWIGRQVNAALGVQMLADAEGNPRLATGWFASTTLTPTRLPIERAAHVDAGTDATVATHVFVDNGNGQAKIDLQQSWTAPPMLPSGWYRPKLTLQLDEYAPEPETPANPLIVADKLGIRRQQEVWLPIIRIGEPAPPRVPWCLLTETSSSGSRGPCAREDDFAIAPRIATPSEPFVVPRFDVRSGSPHQYLLEPFLPSISVGDRGIAPSPPLVPFRFPSGELTVTITKPDGSIRTIGPSPFRQSRSRTQVSRSGIDLGVGGGHITNAYQLSTMSPDFEAEFDQDGLHEIRMEGWIEDVWGNVWTGSGTYQIIAAEPLDLDTAVLPGTPFEVGDGFTPSVTMHPPVPAEVIWRFQLVEGTGAEKIERTIHGSTNRFGHYYDDPILLDREGEYRVDLHARYRAPDGRIFAGSRTWGGVVASPQTDVIAHGKRGVDGLSFIGPQWFFRNHPEFPPIPGGHVMYPFASGDVQWAENRDAALPIITMGDPLGSVVSVLWPDASGFQSEEIQAGEIPLMWNGSAVPDPYIDPDDAPIWAYSYRSVQRPGARVREQIGEFGPSLYWRFDDQYDRQSGVGLLGDLPNDIKFQFGGLVVRGPAIDKPRYAIYGSLFVLVPDSEQDPRLGSRVFPPFQGNGGGPSGGPLFTLKGKEIDIFFHPTGVRPGTVLLHGNRASFSGRIGPTLPSKVEITITSPSGKVRTIEGQANKVGYFYDPTTDFRVDEVGVWTTHVRVWHDGMTSAGQVQLPYPEGDVLGSRDGEFWFYVVESSSQPLYVEVSSDTLTTSPAGVTFVRPADGPVTFTIAPPEELSDAELIHTTVMPGFILEEGIIPSPLASRSSPHTYNYDAQSLAQDFPNLDLHDADGFAGVDTVTMSFMITGRDATGATRHFARQIVLQGEELQMPEQDPSPPRQRPVRRR